MSISALLLAFSLAQTPAAEGPVEVGAKPRPGIPAYLPRAIHAGSFIYRGTVTPQLRLQWEIILIRAKRDAFLLMAEGGGGYGLAFPRRFGATGQDAMTYLYQHTLLAGIAYRAAYSGGFAWGFHVGTGPVFYGARIQNAPSERFITGWVDGGAQVGLKVGAVTYGLSFRFANLYDLPRRSLAGPYVGGPYVGFYAEGLL